MSIKSVKLHNVQIISVYPVKFPDGSIGTEAQVTEESLSVLKSSGLLAWDETQKIKDCPTKWINTKTGEPHVVWASQEQAKLAATPIAEEKEPVEEM